MLQFAQQVMASHDKANKQADLDVSPAMGDTLTEMQGCLTQLYGNAAIRDPEAVAQLIAEKAAAMNTSSSDASAGQLARGGCWSAPTGTAKLADLADSSAKMK